ncbi:MAG TPA: hypothetical protein PLJ27_08415 [Polyangiaceae bacterium]|nr:MAG: hypothetical protein BWY17_03257 [Deltaproteobacteria bacterium ADurb.Bin207]HNZ24788.1 hypothetical protein [Polyangiaceae bacterium]HOD25080.1 hypothetical protein [Polyangiaceae bacterium]HOE50531.1 hypothetical protein [Polyangiaceae bacterium]HOH02851.1 hypothetical protein [Polyangiaceae bacterium]
MLDLRALMSELDGPALAFMQDLTIRFDMNLVFATPRKPPRGASLHGRVAVLDLAFVSDAISSGFERITLSFIEELGPRLAVWVDHHDHEQHARFASDPRFVLCTKAEHGACPELITPALVERIGPVDTLVCHTDFDGLASAAKWIRKGIEPYEGCDADARIIDTRIGNPSSYAEVMDRALRARPNDHALFGLMVRHLAQGLKDASLWIPIREAAEQLRAIEAETRKLALAYVRLAPGVAFVDVSHRRARIDKTLLLLLGQEREPIAMVLDRDTINLATRFDGGVNLLKLLGLSGGMPTRVSVPRKRLERTCEALGVDWSAVEPLLVAYHP